jgi:hypothetical protein
MELSGKFFYLSFVSDNVDNCSKAAAKVASFFKK